MEKPVLDNEVWLLQQVAIGDTGAYAKLYKVYYPFLFENALKILKSKQSAEDVCGEVFMNLWQRRQTLPEIASLSAYLITAARNRSINVLKTIARSAGARNEMRHSFPTSFLSAEAEFLNKEYVAFIHKQVNSLPPRAKEVFTLCREEGYSYDEVSAKLEISRNAVKAHMVFSMKKLKSFAQKELGISFLFLLLFHF